MCYFCNRKDTHCGVVCAIIYLRVIRTREQPRNASAFFWVWLLPFFCVRQLSRGQAAGRLPRSAERGILPAPAGAGERVRSQRSGGAASEQKSRRLFSALIALKAGQGRLSQAARHVRGGATPWLRLGVVRVSNASFALRF